MSLIFALATTAFAGTLVTLDPTRRPDLDLDEVSVPAEAIVPDVAYTPVDAHAMRSLGEELIAVRPLMHKFDGELEIMSRLEAVVSEVGVVRDQQERRLMYQALAFEGFAVQRYFQDELATDPLAEPYRIIIDDHVEVKAWVDAVALDPFHEPSRNDISEAPELTAFNATRDRLLYAHPSTLIIANVPAGARVLIDGQELLTDPAAGLRIYAGRHHASVLVGGAIVQRDDFLAMPGETHLIKVPPSKVELEALKTALRAAPPELDLAPALIEALDSLPGPVRVSALSNDGELAYYHLVGDTLVRQAAKDSVSRSVTASLHGGFAWIHDVGYGDDFSSANALTPQVGAQLSWPVALSGLPPVVAGVGVDVAVPTGADQALRIGDHSVRMRWTPYLHAGLERVQVTLGVFGPSHVAVGARASLPLFGKTSLEAALQQGIVRFRSDSPAALPTLLSLAITAPIGD